MVIPVSMCRITAKISRPWHTFTMQIKHNFSHTRGQHRRIFLFCLGSVLAGALVFVLLSPQAWADDNHPSLSIEGGTAVQRQNILALTAVERRSCQLAPHREDSLIREVEEKTRLALRAIGFYSPEITTRLSRTDTCWSLSLRLDPGPPTLLNHIEIILSGEGEKDPVLQQILDNPRVRLNEAVRHDQYDALRNRLSRTANEQGYFDAYFSMARLEIDRESLSARIRLHLNTGTRYRFGNIEFVQDILNESFIERLLPISPGDPYSARDVITLQQDITASSYFDRVQVRTLLDERDEGMIPVRILTEPRKRTAYSVRLGTSTDLGPRVGAAIDRRYANQLGHSFNSEIELSPIRSSLGGAYVIPLTDPLRERLNIFSSLRTETIDNKESDRIQVGAERIAMLPSAWKNISGIRLEYEEFTAGENTNSTHLIIPSLRLSKTHSDDPLWTNSGYRTDFLLQGASENIGSSETFLQARATGKYIDSLQSWRLSLRADVGATIASELTNIPTSLRYFAGGDTSVRGYGFQRLSPRDDEGRIIGGRYLLVTGAEIDYPLGSTPVHGAVFLDAGNAFDNLTSYQTEFGYGIGIRWRSPIGPLRLDIATAPNSSDRFRIHFTMGPDL